GSGGPLSELLDGSLPVADGGSDSFGAFVGSSTTHTFTVRNIGATTLTLSSTINLPSGFTLVSGFGSTSLAPGVSTTFTVGVNTATATAYSGTVSFGTNDPKNNPFAFTLTGTVGGSVILANGPAGFNEAGSGWPHYTGAGYNNNLDYAAAGSGANTASWELSGLTTGTYDVQMTWTAVADHATNAIYSVYDG